MTDKSALEMFSISTVVVAGLWLLRELGSRAIQDISARTGNVGFIRESSDVLEVIREDDGESIRTMYTPRTKRKTRDPLLYVNRGYLFNDADTPLLLQNPVVTFWAEDGPRMRHVSPRFFAADVETKVVTIPGHGSVPVRVELNLWHKDLSGTYGDSIPILEMDTVSNRFFRFPLTSMSFWQIGDTGVGWDARKNRVIRAGTKQWVKARLKGSLSPMTSKSRLR